MLSLEIDAQLAEKFHFFWKAPSGSINRKIEGCSRKRLTKKNPRPVQAGALLGESVAAHSRSRFDFYNSRRSL